MTENSYSYVEVTDMEVTLLKKHDFVAYAPEPMLFLNRQELFISGFIVAVSYLLFYYSMSIFKDSSLPPSRKEMRFSTTPVSS